MQRGFASELECGRFLRPHLDHLHDPFLLPDAQEAVERIAAAIQNGEKILVHGDYDVDGVCAAALLTRVLRKLNANVQPFVPHRRVDGYDLQPDTVRREAQNGTRLIITADCGIVAFEAAKTARKLGVDLIITDHHEPDPDGELPDALAVVNPKSPVSDYPFPDICGTGVAYKLCTALLQHLGVNSPLFRTSFLDLVALATCADCMPLVNENRVFVQTGLDTLRTTKKAGLQALMRIASLTAENLTTRSLGFALGPRINAIGRLDAAEHALNLLLTADVGEADTLAERLEQANKERQQEQERIFGEAMRQAERFLDDRVLVLASHKWHPGIIGIVASKIAEALCRPTIIISIDEESRTARGSCRSVEEFDIFEALNACREFLGSCGGHQAAAGFSIEPENIEPFREAMQQVAESTLDEEMLQPTVRYDAEIPISAVDQALSRDLRLLEPFGHGNHEPVFMSRGLNVLEQKRLASKTVNGPDHLKFRVEHPFMRYGMDAVFWRNWLRAEECPAGSRVDVCYVLEASTYNGQPRLQLMVKDFRPHQEG